MTSYEQVNDWFFSLIEKDWEFFNYYGITEKEAVELAQERANKYREEAIRLIVTKCLPQVDFSNRAYDEKGVDIGFNFDFNSQEEFLVPMLMYRLYLLRDYAKLKTYNVNFTSSEIKVFDPSNARTSFNTLYKQIESETDQLLDDYKNTDRRTGEYKSFDPAKFDKTI